MSEQPEHPVMLLDAKSAAAFLLISEPTLWRHASAGRLPVVKIGGRTMFLREDLESFIRSRRMFRDPGKPAKSGRPRKAGGQDEAQDAA